MLAVVRRHPVAIGFMIVMVLAIGLRLVGNDDRPERSGVATPVIVTAVAELPFVDQVEALGTTRANESVVITAKVTETVRRVNFHDGQVVEEGDILIELTSGEEAALLEEAKANLVEAELQYERVADLVSRGHASRARLDEQTGIRNSALARVGALEARLSDRLIRAPFAGVLGFRRVSPGTLVTPGTDVTTLDDIGVIKLDFAIPEVFLATMRPGLEVKALSAAYPGREFSGIVRTVESRVDPTTRAVQVRAEVDNSDFSLRPGMLLTVAVIRSREALVAVPEAALVPVQDRQHVYVVEDGRAVQKLVEIGRRQPGYVEIVSGLAVGERVVIEGTMRLRDGIQVTVQEVRPMRGALAQRVGRGA